MNAIAIIPAKGYSRRIQNKNFRDFHGKQIISYSIETALTSGLFDGGVWVSSENESDLGRACMLRAGWIRRAPEYAEVGVPDCGTQEVVRQALLTMARTDELERAALGKCSRSAPEFVCCIYATAPMMTAGDLRNGYNVMRVTDDYAFVPGWFYWGRAEWFGVKPLQETPPLVVEEERYIDIDTIADWKRAEEMYAALHKVAA